MTEMTSNSDAHHQEDDKIMSERRGFNSNEPSNFVWYSNAVQHNDQDKFTNNILDEDDEIYSESMKDIETEILGVSTEENHDFNENEIDTESNTIIKDDRKDNNRHKGKDVLVDINSPKNGLKISLTPEKRLKMTKKLGRWFVNHNLEDFKKIGKDKPLLFIDPLIKLRDYCKSISKNDITSNLGKYLMKEKYHKIFDHLYTELEIVIIKLQFSIEWIEKRIEFVHEKALKNEIISIRMQLISTIIFYKKLHSLLRKLNEPKQKKYTTERILSRIENQIIDEDSLNDNDKQNKLGVVCMRLRLLIGMYSFIKSASSSELESEPIHYVIPTPGKESERKGNSFVKQGLYDFKDKTRPWLLVNYIKDLRQYYDEAQSNNIVRNMRDIIIKFEQFVQEPKKKFLMKEFSSSLSQYKEEYKDAFKLQYAIEWIEKRLDFISDEEIKNDLIEIKKGIAETKQFYEKSGRVVYSLHSLVKKMLRTEPTQDIAYKIVNLIFELRELSFVGESFEEFNKVSVKIQDLSRKLRNTWVRVFIKSVYDYALF